MDYWVYFALLKSISLCQELTSLFFHQYSSTRFVYIWWKYDKFLQVWIQRCNSDSRLQGLLQTKFEANLRQAAGAVSAGIRLKLRLVLVAVYGQLKGMLWYEHTTEKQLYLTFYGFLDDSYGLQTGGSFSVEGGCNYVLRGGWKTIWI